MQKFTHSSTFQPHDKSSILTNMLASQSKQNTILIVDDEIEICRSLEELLVEYGYSVLFTTNPNEALGILAKHSVQLAMLDIRMPQLDGLKLLQSIKQEPYDIPVIMITGYPGFKSAVTAMRYGAVNIFTKPIKFTDLLVEIQTILGTKQTQERNSMIHPEEIPPSKSSVMQKIIRDIPKIARTDAPIIITGESGTGKEVIANLIHRQSQRKLQEMVKVNCAAIPEALMEAELFGCVAGAYTDAKEGRAGKFEIANKGTLFLDEIGDMSIVLQAKILRVLQEQEFERIGSSKVIRTDVRIIAATNKDFSQLFKEGLFREDLYYRLSVVEISLPPLRQRKEDIEGLSRYFLRTYSVLYNRPNLQFSERALEILTSHEWPGNIRELKNTIERAVIFCEGDRIMETDFPTQYRSIKSQQYNLVSPYEKAVDELDRERIIEALKRSDGSKSRAADLLRMHRKTLYNKMKRLGLD